MLMHSPSHSRKSSASASVSGKSPLSDAAAGSPLKSPSVSVTQADTPSKPTVVSGSHRASYSYSTPAASPSKTQTTPSASPAKTQTTPSASPAKTQTAPSATPSRVSVRLIDNQSPEKQQQEQIRNWLSESFSINVPEPTDDAASFWEAFRDGVVFLEIVDKLRPGMVNWGAIARPKPGGRRLLLFQRLSNCSLAAQSLMEVVPALHRVDGKDISEANSAILKAIFQEMVRSVSSKK